MRWYSFKEKEKVESSSNSLVVLVVPMFEYASNLLVKMNICFQKQQMLGGQQSFGNDIAILCLQVNWHFSMEGFFFYFYLWK